MEKSVAQAVAETKKYVTDESLGTFASKQKVYIDKGDKKNTDSIAQLVGDVNTLSEDVNTLGEDVNALKESVNILETGSPFYVAAYAKGTNDNVPLFTQGNPEICKKFDFYLLDTTDNSGEVTHPVGKLMKNNLFHFANGGYAPVVGITQAMYDECMTNAVYTRNADGSTYTELYAAGDFDAAAQWEVDKALLAAKQEATVLYKSNAGSYELITHVLRPWETVETKYTIGIAPAQDLYILDNVVGTSGRYWKGLFTEPRIWDGIDLSKYKLARTAMGPGPMTTVGNKCRNFFYIYEADNNNCKSSSGFITNNPFYNKDRHYPRVADVNQISNMNFGRANNSDTARSYPFAEGGWWATNAYIIALELLAGTRYYHKASQFGSGISSNDQPRDESTLFTNGGVRLKDNAVGTWFYKAWYNACDPYYVWNGEAFDTLDMANLFSGYRPKEACMESQMAASMATELGIAPTDSVNALNTFKFYGDTYYYMSVPGFAGLQDGDMNVRVYKVLHSTNVQGYNQAGVATTFEFEIIFRMSLYGGANLSGDIWAYNGGGFEMVGTRETAEMAGHHVDAYLQPDQKKWHHDTIARKAIGEVWDFEKNYMKVGEYNTLGDSWALERMSNSPIRIQRAGNVAQGECYFMWDNCYWADQGQRGRMRSMFRGRSAHSACSPRALAASHDVLDAWTTYGGSFQALIEPQA